VVETAFGLVADAELAGVEPLTAASVGGWALASVRPKAATASAPAQTTTPAWSGRNGWVVFALEMERRRIRLVRVQSEALSAFRN